MTLSVDQVVFHEPIRVGELVTSQASVDHTGRTSVEIGIRVTTEDLRAGEVQHTNSCCSTMVALDAARRPVAVPPLKLATDDQRRRHAAAVLRRDLRREVEARTEDIRPAIA